MPSIVNNTGLKNSCLRANAIDTYVNFDPYK